MTPDIWGYHKASNFFQGREGGGGRECNADTEIVWEPHSLTAAPDTCTQLPLDAFIQPSLKNIHLQKKSK